MEERLERLGDPGVGHRDDRRRRHPVKDLLGQVRPGHQADRMAREHFADDLGRPHPRALLEPLGQREHRHPRAQVRGDLLERLPDRVGGHADDEHVGGAHGLGQVARRLERLLQLAVVQEAGVRVLLVDLPRGLLAAGPEHGRGVGGGERGDRGPPRSASEDGDADRWGHADSSFEDAGQ